MIKQTEKILSLLATEPIASVKAAYISRIKAEKDWMTHVEGRLLNDGYEIVGASGLLTDDGRQVLRVGNKAFALRPEIHAQRLAEAFAAEQAEQVPTSDTKSVVGTESLSAMMCSKCGDALQHTSVCPSCAAGKLGYRHRYTCVCGGADLVSKDRL